MVNILIQWMLAGMLSMVHPFFMSVIDINHNNNAASLEISVRVFTDDLEKTLEKFSKQQFDIQNPKDKPLVEKSLLAYMTEHLKLKVNGKATRFTLVGFEQQLESTWCYFEIEKQPIVNQVAVDCSLLYDYETKQVNIIHVKSKGIQKTYKMDYPKQDIAFSF